MLLLVIYVLAVVMIAMMSIAGAIGLLVVVEAVELETGNNAQVLLNYLKSIHRYINYKNYNKYSNNHYMYGNNQHSLNN